jgi:hypothetical protein
MKQLILVLICCLVTLSGFAQQQEKQEKQEPEQKKGKLLESLNLDDLSLKSQRPQSQIQEQVSVEADQYPGLDINIQNPVESLGSYKPFTKQELRAYSDLITDYKLTNYHTTGTARPQQPGRLFQLRLPQESNKD